MNVYLFNVIKFVYNISVMSICEETQDIYKNNKQ